MQVLGGLVSEDKINVLYTTQPGVRRGARGAEALLLEEKKKAAEAQSHTLAATGIRCWTRTQFWLRHETREIQLHACVRSTQSSRWPSST